MDQLSTSSKNLISFFLSHFKDQNVFIFHSDSSSPSLYERMLKTAHPNAQTCSLSQHDLRLVQLPKGQLKALLCLSPLNYQKEDEWQRIFWSFSDALSSEGECWLQDCQGIELIAKKNRLLLIHEIKNLEDPSAACFLRFKKQ
jgi:hypothetical protein